MTVASSSRRRIGYRCTSGRLAEASSRCKNTSLIIANTLDAAVWEAIMTVLREPEYFEQEMVQRIDQDDKQDSIRALTRHVKDLEAQEVSMSKAIRYMGDDDAGIERLVADLKEATRERKHAQEELEQ